MMHNSTSQDYMRRERRPARAGLSVTREHAGGLAPQPPKKPSNKALFSEVSHQPSYVIGSPPHLAFATTTLPGSAGWRGPTARLLMLGRHYNDWVLAGFEAKWPNLKS
jgi:hypothetical protein